MPRSLRALGALALSAQALAAQRPTLTNAIGMEFVLINPGTMLVGQFQPRCPERNERWTSNEAR